MLSKFHRQQLADLRKELEDRQSPDLRKIDDLFSYVETLEMQMDLITDRIHEEYGDVHITLVSNATGFSATMKGFPMEICFDTENQVYFIEDLFTNEYESFSIDIKDLYEACLQRKSVS